jgi:hypothetical protein
MMGFAARPPEARNAYPSIPVQTGVPLARGLGFQRQGQVAPGFPIEGAGYPRLGPNPRGDWLSQMIIVRSEPARTITYTTLRWHLVQELGESERLHSTLHVFGLELDRTEQLQKRNIPCRSRTIRFQKIHRIEQLTSHAHASSLYWWLDLGLQPPSPCRVSLLPPRSLSHAQAMPSLSPSIVRPDLAQAILCDTLKLAGYAWSPGCMPPLCVATAWPWHCSSARHPPVWSPHALGLPLCVRPLCMVATRPWHRPCARHLGPPLCTPAWQQRPYPALHAWPSAFVSFFSQSW